MRLHLMTYNMYSGRDLDGNYDLAGKIAAIRACAPDILSLNEVHRCTHLSRGADQAEEIAQACGFPYRFYARTIDHDGGEYGIALLSRYPILNAENRSVPPCFCPDKSPEPRTVIDAMICCGEKTLHVLTTHFGLSDREQQAGAAHILRLTGDRDTSTVVMGDLNCTPDSAVIGSLCDRFADTAAWQTDGQRATYRNPVPSRKIDYIFVSRDLTVLEAAVPALGTSDHRPVTCEIAF